MLDVLRSRPCQVRSKAGEVHGKTLGEPAAVTVGLACCYGVLRRPARRGGPGSRRHDGDDARPDTGELVKALRLT